MVRLFLGVMALVTEPRFRQHQCLYVLWTSIVYTLCVCVCVFQSKLSDEDKAVLADEVLSTPDFISGLRKEFVEDLNALKALSAHGPV